MKLKKLVILGFKSFADRTVLHFDHGITCIVGPNGCGKSNISDAFRWVLGEQSAKSMRGQKMPDVIFAGTERRKPLNIAEVSITLTDVQGSLPIDYEEVTLTRKLHRSGESEYFINGQLVRLKDIQSLFLDSGIGHQAFSIFEQGKIDQVISYTPLERRHIFEEAAGILRFLQRKKEALKRLEQADLNLARVKDIHQEVEKQIEVLKDQAEKARIFKDHKSGLEELEKASYVMRWDAAHKKGMEIAQKQQVHQQEVEELLGQMAKSHQTIQQAKIQHLELEKQAKAKNEERFKWRSEKEIQSREQLSYQDSIQESQQKEKKLKREIEELKITQQTRTKQLKDIRTKHTALEEQFQEAEGKLSLQHDRVKSQEEEMAKQRVDLQAKQQKRLKLLQQESQLESEWKQQEVRLENHQERKKRLEERQHQFKLDSEQIVRIAQEKKQQLNQMSNLVDTHKERLESYEDELRLMNKTIEDQQKEMDGLKRKTVEQKARHQALLKMREDHEGFSQGSKKLLQESQQAKSALHGKIRPLYEFFQADKSVAQPLSAILRSYAHTLVVPTEEDFKAVLAFAEARNIQDYSLLCLEWIAANIQAEQLSSWTSKITFNTLVGHFLSSIESCSTHQEGLSFLKRHPHYGVWSEQGAFFDRYHVFFHFSQQDSQIFLRESELRELQEEIEQKEEALKALEKTMHELQQRKAKMQLERSELDKILRKDEMKLVEINFGLQRALSDQDKMKKELAQLDQDLQSLIQQIEQQRISLEQLKDKHAIAKQELLGLNQEVEFLEKEIERQEKALRIQLQDHKAKNEVYQQLMEQKRQLLHQGQLLEAQEQEHYKQEQRIQEELMDCQSRQELMREKDKTVLTSLEDIEKRLQAAEQACEQMDQGLQQHRQGLEVLEQEARGYHDRLKQVEGALGQLEMQIAQQKSNAQALARDLQDLYQMSIEEARASLSSSAKSLEQVEKQIRILKQQLQSMGDVNMTSIEELEKHKVRYDFLNQQMGDLTGSKDELMRMIRQLDTESRRLFRETFEVVRANFQKNFSILFNGGEADLQFTETENILEAGIEIVAKPPGKQMRAISLLSGGEKCLTAVALLFAIFEVKPSPFCILDEIDAPLDDANVERFVNVVKHFADRCQFLIITHNKRTMAVGDVLFGVSMEERGVSKLLSLEFSHQSAPEAILV